MSTILEALRKAELGNSNLIAGRRTTLWENACKTIAGCTKQPGETRKWLKPGSIVTLPLIFVLAGAIPTDIWLTPPGITAAPGHLEVSPHRDSTSSERWKGPLTLRGAIAPGLNIKMHLVRKGSKLSGTYVYDRFGKDILLQGTVGEAESISLNEFVTGRKTGTFTGKFVSDGRIQGKWSKQGSTKSRDFFLVTTGLPFDRVGDKNLLTGEFGHILSKPPENRPTL